MCANAEAGSSAAPRQPDSSLPQQEAFDDQLPEAPGLRHCTVSNSNTAALPMVSRDRIREHVKGSDQAETDSPPYAAVSTDKC